MKKKKVLVDLSILKNINCGLGQVALNYGNYYKENYTGDEAYKIYLLVPKKFFGAFGDKVNYISSNWFYKHLHFLTPHFDVWHSIHQLSRYFPANKSAKIILTIHDFNFVYEKKSRKDRIEYYLKGIQKKADRASLITAISEFSKKETEKYLNLKGKNVTVIHNGIERLNAEYAKKPDFILNDKPFFFTIGEVKRKKNFHVLLPLMKLFPEKQLYIAGRKGSSYSNEIEEAIKSENISNVHLVDIVSNKERIWLYKNCEAFLFPSLFEGFGLPIIEAMSFGKPVFSSSETSLKEIGGKHAFFWNNFEPEEMKKIIDENLDKFYSSPDLAKESIDYAHSFSYEKHMEQYLSLYLQLLNN